MNSHPVLLSLCPLLPKVPQGQAGGPPGRKGPVAAPAQPLQEPSLSMLMGSQRCRQHTVTKIISAPEMMIELIFTEK